MARWSRPLRLSFHRLATKITLKTCHGANRAAREQFISSEPYPASTLLVVAGLADPAMLVEIEVVAAKG